MRWPESLGLCLILALTLVLGCLYAVHTPAWQAPDEPAHYNFVRYLDEFGSLPVLHPGDYPHAYLEQIKAARFPTDMSVAPLRYEFWQPPLYYLLATPVYRLSGGSLLALRMFSVVLGAGVVAAAYAVVRAAWPSDGGLALGTAAFVAFVPMHLASTASVNNDVLAELLIAIVALRVIALIGQTSDAPGNFAPRLIRTEILTGVLLGLGLVTKLTVYYTALPLVLVGLWLRHRRPAPLLRHGAVVLLPALLLSLPWYARNVAIYGWPDLLGKLNHDSVVVGQMRTAVYLGQIGWAGYLRDFVTTTFHSFWGQFGWMAVPMNGRAYLVLGLLSALATVGVAVRVLTHPRTTTPGAPHPPAPSPQSGEGGIPPLHFMAQSPAVSGKRGLGGERLGGAGSGVERENSPRQVRIFALLAIWLALVVAGYFYYNLTFVQFQGRYLFPGLIPIGLLAVTGWRTIFARRRALLGAAVCALVTAAGTIGNAVGGSSDKYALALGAGVTGALAVRRWLPSAWDAWLWALPLVGLAGLSGYSLFVFVVPNL